MKNAEFNTKKKRPDTTRKAIKSWNGKKIEDNGTAGALWIENLDSYLGNCTTNPNWETIIKYYGDGEFPNEKVEIAPWYSDIDYTEWQRRMEEEDE